jgi:hypothetical protein
VSRRLRENIAYLKEFMYGSSFMGASFPGPEPGNTFSKGTLFPGLMDDPDGNGPKDPEKKPRPRKPGVEREEPRWRKR